MGSQETIVHSLNDYWNIHGIDFLAIRTTLSYRMYGEVLVKTKQEQKFVSFFIETITQILPFWECWGSWNSVVIFSHKHVFEI